MERKKFIEQIFYGTTSVLFLPAFISSCKKETLFDETSFKGEVIVVGAGAAGLYAAYLLNQQGINVKIIEASDRIGGRIKSINNFADFGIELGAEKVWGEYSIWYDLVRASGANFIANSGNKLYYFNGSIKTEVEATTNTYFNQMNDIINAVGDYAGGDVTAEAYGNISGLNDNVRHIYNALIANKIGSSETRIGMHGLRSVEERRTAGISGFMLKDKTFQEILESQFSSVMDKIVYNKAIQQIDYSTGKVRLTDQNGEVHEADKVIVTASLGVLQSGMIEFNPALNAAQTIAMSNIGFDRGMKIILRFDEQVWPNNTGQIFSNGIIPEYYPTAANERSSDDRYLTAFVCGEKAEQLFALGENMIPTILTDLDGTLGEISSHYIDHIIQDWGSEPFILGAMSYPKPGTGNSRIAAFKNLGSKVFFAGEAAHNEGHHGTIHGAMESALKAVTEILQPQ